MEAYNVDSLNVSLAINRQLLEVYLNTNHKSAGMDFTVGIRSSALTAVFVSIQLTMGGQ